MAHEREGLAFARVLFELRTALYGSRADPFLPGAALLLPVLAYALTRLWFRYQG
jgi:hypothetical protein